ncbi:MAG: amino acid ABC transporter ATP-binding protein [Nitrospirae bacterium]|nr:amino acid ABC transporter ATP-binding protein [Nitrospirota bacterium]
MLETLSENRSLLGKAVGRKNSGSTIIEFINVNKTFSTTCMPLKNINLKVSEGEVLAICGPSGAGKSTLLRAINRLERVDSGEIIVDGKRLSDPKINLTVLRAEIGMVFQHLNLYPHKTALENITLAQRVVRGLSRKAANETAMKLLEKVKLAHKCDAYPVQLSGGEQQRVAIARSLAMEPKTMLFDEPTSALDPELIGEVLDVIHNLAEEGMTMIIVTHEMGFAQNVAHWLAFMDSGEILEIDIPAEIISNPRHPRTRAFMSTILSMPSNSKPGGESG